MEWSRPVENHVEEGVILFALVLTLPYAVVRRVGDQLEAQLVQLLESLQELAQLLGRLQGAAQEDVARVELDADLVNLIQNPWAGTEKKVRARRSLDRISWAETEHSTRVLVKINWLGPKMREFYELLLKR